VVIAAATAFASTGNAGILTASRYPLAMARDRLLWSGFERLGRFQTPTVAVIFTSLLMIASIVFLDVERLASLGSAFLLLLFALVNLSVIFMRESGLSSYAPGYRSPLYPWIQILGFLITFGLIFTLGVFYIVFILVVLTIAVVWYLTYVRERVTDRAAVYGLFRRLGERHDAGVDEELWAILQERGVDEGDSFDQLIADAEVLDLDGKVGLSQVLDRVAGVLRQRHRQPLVELDASLDAASARGIIPDHSPAFVLDLMRHDLERPEVVLVRVKRGVRIASGRRFPGSEGHDDASQDLPEPSRGPNGARVHAVIVLLTPDGRPTRHLRLLAQLVTMVEEEGFGDRWRRAHDEQELLETLLRDEWFASIVVGAPGPPAEMVDKRLRDVAFPGNTLVALVRRGDRTIVPHGDTLLRAGDRLTVIGAPDHVATLQGHEGHDPKEA
jgi:basic amino acid/polyamine antiporter, APA family